MAFDTDKFLENIMRIQGAHDMLRESAKHFRQLSQGAHAVMADRHADELEKIGAQPQVPQSVTDTAFAAANQKIDELLAN